MGAGVDGSQRRRGRRVVGKAGHARKGGGGDLGFLALLDKGAKAVWVSVLTAIPAVRFLPLHHQNTAASLHQNTYHAAL